MALPPAPVTTASEKLFYLADDDGGAVRANVALGIHNQTIDGENVAHTAVASHEIGQAIGGTDPVVLIGVYDDNGDVEAPILNLDGGVRVSGPATDNNTFTQGTDKLLPIAFIFDEVAGTGLTENNAAAARIDAKRAQVIVGEDATTRGRRWLIDAEGALSAKEKRAATAALTNVASSASSVTLLSATAGRLGATIWNDSTEILYVKFGTTASATSATVKLVADAYYEIPFGYTGRIDGIWASANGSARITEVTA